MNEELICGWRQRLSRSLHLSRSKPESRYFQLATIDHEGKPDNRTVVFRGFDDSIPHWLKVITDLRSQKWPQLTGFPHASVCWYFAKTREQYRIQCGVELCSHDDPRLSTEWEKLSRAARAQFYWGIPGSRIEDTKSEGSTSTALDDFPCHFGVINLMPHKVDYLNLTQSHAGIPQLRERYDLGEQGWTVQSIVP